MAAVVVDSSSNRDMCVIFVPKKKYLQQNQDTKHTRYTSDPFQINFLFEPFRFLFVPTTRLVFI